METYLLEGFFLEGRPTGPAFQDALAAHHQYIAQQAVSYTHLTLPTIRLV